MDEENKQAVTEEPETREDGPQEEEDAREE